jgi:chaperonin cofactor prefoldin
MATNASQPSEEDIEKLERDYQMLQEQMRTAALQLDQLQNLKADLERAKAELDKATGKVYLTIGNVIVETTKEKALADIKDRAELTDARMQSANKQYTELKSKEKSAGDRLTQLYKQGQGGAV